MATRLRLSALIVGTRYEIIYVAMLKPCDIVREMRCSLQLCVLRFGFLQDGDVGVGVFP